MRISDWSSDVCSSDLSSVTSRMAPRRLLRTTSGLGSDIGIAPPDDERVGGKSAAALGCYDERIDLQLHDRDRLAERKPLHRLDRVEGGRQVAARAAARSEGSRAGKEGVSPCRFRGLRRHKKKKIQ